MAWYEKYIRNYQLCLGGELRVVEMQAPVLVQWWTGKRGFVSVPAECSEAPQEVFFGGRLLWRMAADFQDSLTAGDGTGLLLTPHLLLSSLRAVLVSAAKAAQPHPPVHVPMIDLLCETRAIILMEWWAGGVCLCSASPHEGGVQRLLCQSSWGWIPTWGWVCCDQELPQLSHSPSFPVFFDKGEHPSAESCVERRGQDLKSRLIKESL